jgi:signal transduction histidine kinase
MLELRPVSKRHSTSAPSGRGASHAAPRVAHRRFVDRSMANAFLRVARRERCTASSMSSRLSDGQRAEASLRHVCDELEHRIAVSTRELLEARVRLDQEKEKLRRAEKLSSLGLLASSACHEISNPLAGVMSLVKALHEGRVQESSRDEYFVTICDGLERMRLILRGMLDFGRARPSLRSEFAAAEMAQSCVRLIAPATRMKDLRLDVLMPDDLALCADRSQIMQAMVNVLMNGVYVAPERSTITILSVESDDRIGLRITDQGPGIAKAELSRLGEPFYTTKAEGEGTGLGLSITRDILFAHGGALSIESELGCGTTVTLWLPRSPQPRCEAMA